MFDDKSAPNMDNVWIDGAIGAIKIISMMYDIITYPVYLLLQRPWEKKALSRRIKAKPIQIDDKSVTYRSVGAPRETHVAMIRDGVTTMEQMLKYCSKKYSEKNCLGTRKILNEEDELQPNGRVFKKYVMGEYEWSSFSEVNKQATSFARGLRLLGTQPKQPVVIFAETRAEWMIAAHGCFKQNIPVVTIYATLGEDAIAHGINETEVSLVITSHELLPKLKNVLKITPKVKTIIYMEDQLHKADLSGFKDVQVHTFNDTMKSGEKSDIHLYLKKYQDYLSKKQKRGSMSSPDNKNKPPRHDSEGRKSISIRREIMLKAKQADTPPAPNDVAIIMYTSGSTGVPKGVLLSHSNMISTVKAFSDVCSIYCTDVFMGYLPLAHVFELLTESVCLLYGIPIGYSTPLTMIDTASKIKRGSKGDASVLHPTIMTSVPLILDRIYKGINDKVVKGGPLKRALFNFAYDYKVKWSNRGFDTPIINKVIFGPIRALLGGNVRLILSGGAPLSPDTHQLTKLCLCMKVIQGYGLTESTSSATVMDRDDMTTGRVGVPTTGCDIRLVDWDEGNYRVQDKPYPRGEIIIGGPNVSLGYFKLPGKTKEDFFEENGRRWFKTGDIGEFHEDGSIKIIDRKKDLVKLQAGEYVSLGKVEAELKTCPIVENICVYGDSTKHFTVALVVPNQQQLIEMAAAGDKTFEQLCQDPKLEKAVLKELEIHAKKCKLEKFEVPAAVKLCPEVWSPDMGLVTAAFKLKRKDIQARYQHEINRMYAS